MKTCKNCFFYKTDNTETKSGDAICVRFPPKIFPMQRINPLTRQSALGFLSIYPNCPSDFLACGEWKEAGSEILKAQA